MTAPRLACFALALPLAFAAAAPAAEPAAWDGAKVSVIARQLVGATDALYDTFYKQPQPPSTPRAARDYDRLHRDIRRLRNQARGFAADVERGEGLEATRAGFENMMVTLRWARERAQSVFTTRDVAERAGAVEDLLAQLAPFYGAGAAVAD